MTLRLKNAAWRSRCAGSSAPVTACATGVIYTARDAAHKRLCELVEAGKPLPFDPMDAVVYYVGPTPAAPGQIIGSAGRRPPIGWMPTRPRSSRLVCAA